ncbi:MAG: leukotoxin LktA family filamentous adhesin [Gammaproteobacteria bacterium]|nr:leukotoxin LktA family filamentous adhesin [Gammaproteobacteria bacterium]
MLASGMLPGWSFANTIETDGSTDTVINTDGNLTDIHTNTQRGRAGFNSFHHFQVSEGNVVNLHLPGAATHLVNLVHDSRTFINGTLNSVKNGNIGGHVIFADPHGFVVGSSGVVNVGSLTVSTPNMTEMGRLRNLAENAGASAEEANALIDQLLEGRLAQAPLAADGSNAIVIQGLVNSNGSINLHGASVLLEASARLNAGTDTARDLFVSTVNTHGLSIGTAAAREDGGIRIVAADDVEIAGELAALMADDSGARIQVGAGKSVTIDGDAQLIAEGANHADGGEVTLEAPALTLAGNARISVRTEGDGTSGDITLNAFSDLGCSFCDESAEAATLDELKEGIDDQANPWLAADLGQASIHIGEQVVLDAGHDEAAQAGSITLDALATNRQLAGYAKASALIEVEGSLIAGDIAISAASKAQVARDVLGSILNQDQLKDDIQQLATAEGWSEEETWANVLDTLYEPIQQYANAFDRDAFLQTPENFSELTLLIPNLSAYLAHADAEVRIGTAAQLLAAGDIALRAESKRTVDSSTWTLDSIGEKIPFGFSAAYGQLSGDTRIAVEQGATLNAGQDLSLLAHSVNSLSVTAEAENSNDGDGNALKTMGLSFGMAMTDLNTEVKVAQGAQVTVGRDVDLLALTEQTINNTVSFKASGDGASGGPAVALSLLNSNTRAEFSADLQGARNLNVTAANLMHEQVSRVTVEAGATKSEADRIKEKADEKESKGVTDYLADTVKGLFGFTPEDRETREENASTGGTGEEAGGETGDKPDGSIGTPTDSKFRLASALGISIAGHEVEAVIGSGSDAPTLDLSGDLSLQALQEQSKLRNVAESTVSSSAKRNDDSTDDADVSLSVAAVYGQLDQITQAIIGDGSEVTAVRMGVAAHNSQTLDLLGLDRWSSLEAVYDNLAQLKDKKQGIVAEFATQYANSQGEAEKLSMAGSLSVAVGRNQAVAWVGDNVTLTATATDAGEWTNTPFGLLQTIDEDEDREALLARETQWAEPLSVQASTSVQQLAVAGNFDMLFGTEASDGGAVGAAVNIQITDNRSIAGMGAGGSVVAEAVNVSARQDELFIGVSPSAGKGPSVAGNASVAVSVVDSTSHASIHSSTDVTADRVNLQAEHELGLWTAVGALAASENVGLAGGVAVNVVNTDVYALIGDNSAQRNGRNLWRPGQMGAGSDSAVTGSWQVNELSLLAQSSGQSGAFAIAGALARSEEEQQAQDQTAAQDGGADKGAEEKSSGLGDALKTIITSGLNLISDDLGDKAANVIEGGEGALEKITEAFDKVKSMTSGTSSGGSGDSSGGDSEGFSLALAASSSINISKQKNRAHLGNIVLDPRDAEGSTVNVLSLNQTHQISGSGAGALTLAGGDKSKFSAALSGAVAFNQIANQTEALVSDVQFNANDELAVTAASSGDQIGMGLGLSVASGGDTNVAVALSGSVGVFDSETRAAVVDAEVYQREAAPGSIAVNAYDRTRSLLGGGAFAVSTDKGGSGGGSLVLAIVQNSLTAEWLGSTAADFDSFTVAANSATRLLTGALAVAVSTGSSSGAGAGSLFAVILDNQVTARVDASATRDASLTGGDVVVRAASVPGLNALSDVFKHDAAAAQTLAASDLDLDGNATAAGIEVQAGTEDGLFEEGGFDDSADDSEAVADTTTHNLFDSGSIAGEAVLGIAGSLGASGGKAGVAGAFGVVYNGSDYRASIANTALDLTGDLDLVARNETDVLAAAIGVAGASNTAVSGSATALIGRGSVAANLDMTGRTLHANDLVVQALKTGGMYSLAGNIAASSNTAAVGGAFSISDLEQSATATIDGGNYVLQGDAVLSAAQQSRIITAALSGAVSAGGSAVGAAFTYNRIADTTKALLSNAAMSVNNLTVTASQPNLGASIWSLAFNLAAGGGSAGVGAGVAVNLVDAERSALVADSTINLTGDLRMSSALDGEIWSLGIDAAGGGTAGVGGSFAANNINGKDEVSISDSTIIAESDSQVLSLDASAGQGLKIASLAGSITGGGTAAVGLAASFNRIAADREALINNATLSGFADIDLKAGVDQAIYAIAIAGGGAGTVAVNGATTTNLLQGTERAAVVGSNITAGGLSLSAAEGDRVIWGLGGVANGAGTVAVGAANVNAIILAKRIAEIDGGDYALDGQLSLKSGGDALIRSAAVGGGGAGTAAVGASVAVNVIDGEETARIRNAAIENDGDVEVLVVDGEADIKTLAGNVQGAGTGAGAGAVAVSVVTQVRQALIENTSLALSASSKVDVLANTEARIDTLALSGAGAGTVAAVVSNTTNNIDARTYAKLVNVSGQAGDVSVAAADKSTINSLAGGAAGAGSVAIGAAVAVNRIGNDIQGLVSGTLNGDRLNLRNLQVGARSTAVIRTASISAGVSGTAAINVGSAVSMLNTNTLAAITNGADIMAERNVALQAWNSDVINSFAGVVAGSGNAAAAGAVTVNLVESETIGRISGSTTRVTALANGAGLQVDNGQLTNAPDPDDLVADAPDNDNDIDADMFKPVLDLQTGTETVHGVAVRATTLQQVGQISASAAVALVPLGSGAVSGVNNASVLSGATLAEIDQALINQDNLGAHAQQALSVGAYSHTYSFGGLFNAAISLGGSGAATVDSGVIARDTRAVVRGAHLASRAGTEVIAQASRAASSIVAGLAGGVVGLNGSASIIVVEGDTEALVDDGSTLSVGSLAIKAQANNRLSPNSGSLAVGAVGAGAGVAFATNSSTVRAWLGAQPGQTQPRTQVTTAGSVLVDAQSNTHLLVNSISGSGGGFAAAGSVNVALIENVTEAGVAGTDIGASGNRAASLQVSATDSLVALSNAGSAAVGGTSLGASANVLIANNATRAQLLDSTVYSSGTIDVLAERNSDVELYTVTGGVGGSVALGGSLGLLMLGSGATQVDDADPMDELNKDNGTLTLVNGFAAFEMDDQQYQTAVYNEATGEYELHAVSNSQDMQTINSTGKPGDTRERLQNNPVYVHETLARVSDSTLRANGSVSIEAQDLLHSRNLAGSAQASGLAAVGGAVAYTLSNARVTAELTGGSTQAGSIDIVADAGQLKDAGSAVNVEAYTGAVGFGVGLGAAVAVGVMNNWVSSHINGQHSATGAFSALARDGLSLTIEAIGAAAGAAAVGVVVGTGKRDSDVEVDVAENSQLAGSAINLDAEGTGGVQVNSLAAAGGLFGAGTAVASVALDSTRVSSQVGHHVVLDGGSNGVKVTASALPDLLADALGATVAGGAAVGASFSRAETANTVNASLGDNLDVRGTGGLEVRSALKYNRNGTTIDPQLANVRATSVAGSGGVFLSANATIAEAYNTANVTAVTGTGLRLPSGQVTVTADSRSHQYADSLGVAVGGLAVGASVAKAESNSETLARLGNGANDRNGDAAIADLVVNATAEDINQAKTVAGSGGVISGNASLASTDTRGKATAEIGDNVNLAVRNLALSAEYTALFGTHANSVNASLAGASGANSVNRVNGQATANIGSSSELYAGQNILVTANNNVFSRHLGEAASGAGGGVISGQAVANDTRITGAADVNVGNASVLMAGLSAQGYSARLVLRAFQQHEAVETVRLSTGGAIAGGGAAIYQRSNLTNNVNVADNVYMYSSGNLGLGTYTRAASATRALASTWGAAGVADASSDVALTSTQNLNIASDVLLEALANIRLTAGDDPEGLYNTSLQLDSLAHSNVRGIIAVPFARADANITNHSNTQFGASSRALAARNVVIGSYNGLNVANADGEARGYQLGFIPVTNRNSHSNVARTSAAAIQGELLAGRFNELIITIDADGNFNQTKGLAVPALFNADFNPRAFLDSFVDMDEVTRAVIEGTVSSSPTGAYELNNLLAAGGTVTVHADTLSGNGQLTAQGGPLIDIHNQSAYYLLIGDALIPDQPGGRVLFTGGAGRSLFNGTLNELGADRRPEIRINNSWGGTSGNVSYGPAIFLTGDIYNQGGLIRIANAKGSLGQFGSTFGQQVLVEVPEGSMTVFTPNSYWSINSNPMSEWRSFASVSGSANFTIQVIATDVYGTNNNMLFRPTTRASGGSGSSVVLYGACLPASTSAAGNCTEATARSFTGSATQFNGMTNTPSWMPLFTARPLSRSTQSYESANLGAGGDGRRIVGGQVGIQARFIDVNGTISSGQATNRTVTVSADLDSWIANHYCSSAICVEAVDLPTHLLTAATGTPIGGRYDFINQRIVMDDVNASGGGFIYMRGGIISTNPSGRIEVNNGFGEVVINNNSSHELQLGNIDTGVGSVGIVQIVDTFKPRVNNQDATVWYVHDQNTGLSIFDNRNGATSLSNAYLVSNSSGANATYNPRANQRFEWSQSADLSRTITRTDNAISSSNWNWVYPASNDANDPWNVTAGQVNVRASANVYEQTTSGSLWNFYNQGVNYHGCGNSIGSSCNWNFRASGVYPSGHERAGEYYSGWNYLMPQNARITINHSVKADNPFAIAFVGNSAGLIDVTTNNNLIIAGRLNNPGGLTRLHAEDNIINGSNGSIFTQTLEMQAAGFVGNQARPIQIGMAGGGTLGAQSGKAGMHLNLSSGAVIRALNAGDGSGNLVMNLNGSLTGVDHLAAGTPHVHARNIDVQSTGAVGTLSNPLQIIAQEVATASGGTSDGVVNVAAQQDIFLREISGDTWAGKIISDNGNVFVQVDQGSLYDAGRRLASDTLDEEQRQSIWEQLSLTSEYGAEANIYQSTVKPFEDRVTAHYREYWRLLELGAFVGDDFVVDASRIDFYRPLAELQSGETGLSDAQVNSLAQARMLELQAFFAEAVGDDWSTQTPFNTYQQDFAYQASAEQVLALTENAIWTEGELRYAVDSAALGSAASTPVGAADPNLSGRQVSIKVNGDTGRLAESLEIDFAALQAGNLTPSEAAALAIANAPGDVVLNRDAGGAIRSLSVNQTLPFYVFASEQFDADVTGSLYLQSAGDLRVGNISVGGNARLAAANSILAASDAGGNFTIADDLTLLAGTGDLGHRRSDDELLTLDVGGRLLSASAGQDVALRWLRDDFRIGRIFAVGDVFLDAVDGSVLGQFDGLAVGARNIAINASGSILGSAGEALQIELESAVEGELNALAGGDARFSSPRSLRVGSIVAHGDLQLDGQVDINATQLHATAGGLQVTAGGQLVLGDISATDAIMLEAIDQLSLGGQADTGSHFTVLADSFRMASDAAVRANGTLTLATQGDMLLGQLHRRGNLAGTLFAMQAGGSILGNGDGQTNLRADRDGRALVVAGQHIGSNSNWLSVDMPELTALEALQGNVFLHTLSDLSGDLVRATNGHVYIRNTPSHIRYEQITAADDFRFDGGSLFVGQLLAGGDADIDVINGLTLGTADVTGTVQVTHSGAVGDRLTWGELRVGERLRMQGPGHWQGDLTLVEGDVSMQLGSAELGRLETAQGTLKLQADRHFAAHELHGRQQWIDLQSGSAALGNVSAALTLNALTQGDLSIFTGTSGENMTLRTSEGSLGSIRFGEPSVDLEQLMTVNHLYSGEDLLIAADGDVFGGNAAAYGEVFISGRNLDFGRAESITGDVQLRAQDDIDARFVRAFRDIGIIAGGSLRMQGYEAQRLSLTAGRDLIIGLGGTLDVEGYAEAGRDIVFDIGGGIDLLGLRAGRDITLRTPGLVNIDETIEAGGSISILADQGVTIGRLLRAGGNIDIDAGELLRSPLTIAGGSINARAGGMQFGDQLYAGVGLGGLDYEQEGARQRWPFAALELPELNALSARGILNPGQYITLESTAGIQLDGLAFSTGAQRWEAAGDITYHSLRTDSGNLDLISAGNLTTVLSDVAGNVAMQVAGNASASALLRAGGSINLQAGSLFSSTQTQAGGLIDAQSNGMSLGNMQAGDTIDLRSGAHIHLAGTADSQGDQNWLAEEDIRFGQLLTRGQAVLDSLLDTEGQRIVAEHGIQGRAGWRGGVATPAQLTLEQAVTPTLQLWSGALIRVGQADQGGARIGEWAELAAQQVYLYGDHTGTDALRLRVNGLNNNAAAGDRFHTILDAREVHTEWLDMVSTDFLTTALLADFEAIERADWFNLQTPQARVIADNLSPQFRSEANVQLYELDKAFWLRQTGRTSYTNAYVLHRNFTHQILVPNFAEGHQDSNVDYQTITSSDHATIMSSGRNALLRLGELMDRNAFFVPASGVQISVPVQGEPVNIEWANPTENEGDQWDI